MAKPIDLGHKISLPWPDRVVYRKEEARRYEAGRLREIDDKRWNKLCEFAANWEQRDRFLVFLAEVDKRALDEGDIIVGDGGLSD